MRLSIPFLTPTITARDRTFFIRQVAILIQSGVAIAEALTLVAEQTSNPALRQAIRVITLDVQNGHPVSVAAARYPELFDETMIAMIKSGEASGQLNTILTDLAAQLESQIVFTAKVRTALLYPAFVVAVMIIVGVILTTVIIPRLRDVFDEIAFSLPWSTRAVLAMSDFLLSYWYVLLVVAAALAIVLRNLLLTPGGREVVARLQTRIPVIAALARDSQLARFTRILAMLLKSGVPIAEAIAIVSTSTQNPAWTTRLLQVKQEVERGVPLSVALTRFSEFPKPLTEMVAVGEQTGQIDTTLVNMAVFYEQQTDTAIKSLTALIEPVVLMIVAVGVGFLVVSVIMPIYNLAQIQ